MPLIVLVGTPCSGKTCRARELRIHFAERGKQVALVSEDEVIKKLGYDKNGTYLDSQKEKRMRGLLMSEVIRLIGKDNLVILDGSNYIKGFRYELYCAAKASKSTQCTIYTLRNHEEAKQANLERRKRDSTETSIEASGIETDATRDNEESVSYSDEVFDALTKFRFEEPNAAHRWDSPLFTVQPTEELDMAAIHRALYENKPPPPNMSTQNPPLGSTNFLYELDRVTQSISAQILQAKQMQSAQLPDYPNCPLEPALLQGAVPQKLLQLRRQFLKYARQHYAGETVELGQHYIRYLNNTVQD